MLGSCLAGLWGWDGEIAAARRGRCHGGAAPCPVGSGSEPPPALAAPPGGRQRCWGPWRMLGPIQFPPRCRSGALRAGCPGPWPDARAPQMVPGAVSRVGRLHAQPCPLPAEPCRAAMGSCAAGTGAKGSPSSSPGPRAPRFTGKEGKGAVGWRSQGSGAKGRLLVPPKAAGWWHPGVPGGSPRRSVATGSLPSRAMEPGLVIIPGLLRHLGAEPAPRSAGW